MASPKTIVYRKPEAVECTRCGMKNLQWVATRWEPLKQGGKLVPADGTAPKMGNVQQTAEGWYILPMGTEDWSESVHALTLGRCKGTTAPLTPAAPPKPQVVQVPADNSDVLQRIAKLESDLDTLSKTRPSTATGSAVDTARIDAIEQQFAQVTPMLDDIRKRIDNALTDMKKQVAGLNQARPLSISTNGAPPVAVGRQHYMMPNALAMAAAVRRTGVVYMVGPAGTGKSTAGAVIAKAVNARKFIPITCGQSLDETDFLGFLNVQGGFVDKWGVADLFENGGMLFLDEVGNNSPSGAVAVNGILVNNEVAFAGGKVIHRHPDFMVVCADNTFGRGADAMYIGRSQLDAATLNRMCYLMWDTDWQLVGEYTGLKPTKTEKPPFKDPVTPAKPLTPTDFPHWLDYIYEISNIISAKHIEAAIGSRQVENGIKLLCAGIDPKLVEWSVIWAHMSTDDANTIQALLKNSTTTQGTAP